jgi:tetratricopeptide (TPR) repeat protein
MFWTRILLLLISFTPAAGQSPTPTPQPTPAPSLVSLRAEGYQALYNLDYEGARRRFQKMIDLAPDHPAGPQCFAASLWIQQLNESWELKSTLYSDKAYKNEKTKVDQRQVNEFRKWTRRTKQLAEARLRKNARDVEALYFLGAAEGLEAAYSAAVERKFMAALRTGSSAVDHHRKVLELSPEFYDAELSIGLQNYVIGSLPLPMKLLAKSVGVSGSKKKGLKELEHVAKEGEWGRDVARVLLVDLYKREQRWDDAIATARELSERFPRNYLFKLQLADAMTLKIAAARKSRTPVNPSEEREVFAIFDSLVRDKAFVAQAELIQFRRNETQRLLK